MNYWKTTYRSLIENGWSATLGQGLGHMERKLSSYSDWGFDLRHGVNTCSLKSIHELDVAEDLKPRVVGYEPTPVRVLRALLRSLPIHYEDFTFVDYGSGKGRALLMASELPFRKVIGLELSPFLHDIASKNIARWNESIRPCCEVVSLNMNALDFELPEEPLLLFFFTPFLAPLLNNTIALIQTRLQDQAHPLHIMYYGSSDDFVDQFGRLGLNHTVVSLPALPWAHKTCHGHLFLKTRGGQDEGGTSPGRGGAPLVAASG